MTLIQYIIVRKDLIKKLKWPIGALIANSCHAVCAVNEATKDDEDTKQYLSPENIDRMHKCCLSVEDEAQLVQLHEKLDTAGVIHKMWIEMPENIPVIIAVKPYLKDNVQNYFSDLKLFR